MNTFFLLLIGLPALEIFIMIKIGAQIGAINTISLIFLTAIIGVFYARLQGIQTLKSGILNIYQMLRRNMNLVVIGMTNSYYAYTNSYDTNVTHHFETLLNKGFQRCSTIERE